MRVVPLHFIGEGQLFGIEGGSTSFLQGRDNYLVSSQLNYNKQIIVVTSERSSFSFN